MVEPKNFTIKKQASINPLVIDTWLLILSRSVRSSIDDEFKFNNSFNNN